MLSYEVTIHLDDVGLAAALEAYMVDKHVGEVFTTGCFIDAHFERTEAQVYRSRYTVASQQLLDRYLTDHAPRLRGDFVLHFPTGVRLSRTVWTQLR
jgi:hypothetical protein